MKTHLAVVAPACASGAYVFLRCIVFTLANRHSPQHTCPHGISVARVGGEKQTGHVNDASGSGALGTGGGVGRRTNRVSCVSPGSGSSSTSTSTRGRFGGGESTVKSSTSGVGARSSAIRRGRTGDGSDVVSMAFIHASIDGVCDIGGSGGTREGPGKGGEDGAGDSARGSMNTVDVEDVAIGSVSASSASPMAGSKGNGRTGVRLPHFSPSATTFDER
jgi:hypothetical protein